MPQHVAFWDALIFAPVETPVDERSEELLSPDENHFAIFGQIVEPLSTTCCGRDTETYPTKRQVLTSLVPRERGVGSEPFGPIRRRTSLERTGHSLSPIQHNDGIHQDALVRVSVESPPSTSNPEKDQGEDQGLVSRVTDNGGINDKAFSHKLKVAISQKSSVSCDACCMWMQCPGKGR